MGTATGHLDLVERAREGSAPALAALVRRELDVVEQHAVRMRDPEVFAERVLLAAFRALRHGQGPGEDVRAWLAALADTTAARSAERDLADPGELPAGWFDRAWVRAARRWPDGRPRVTVPRWVLQIVGLVLVGLVAGALTYRALTAELPTDVLSELVAEPVDDPADVLVPGPLDEPEAEPVPELFEDVELGELPGYDLLPRPTEPGPRPPTDVSETAPGDDTTSEDGATDDDGGTDAGDPGDDAPDSTDGTDAGDGTDGTDDGDGTDGTDDGDGTDGTDDASDG